MRWSLSFRLYDQGRNARRNLATAAPDVVSLTAAEYAFQAPDTLPPDGRSHIEHGMIRQIRVH